MHTYTMPLFLVRALKGAPISCLLALELAGRPVSTAWIAEVTGYSRSSAAAALGTLNCFGLVDYNRRTHTWEMALSSTRTQALLAAEFCSRN